MEVSIDKLGSLIQSGVLSTLAVLIFWRMPSIWSAYLDFVEKTREFEMQKDSEERKFRHDLANRITIALGELQVAVLELKMSSENFCKFRQP